MTTLNCDYEWWLMSKKKTKKALVSLAILGGGIALILLGLVLSKAGVKAAGFLIFLGFLAIPALIVKSFFDKMGNAALSFDYIDKGCPPIEFKTRRGFILPNEKYTGPGP